MRTDTRDSEDYVNARLTPHICWFAQGRIGSIQVIPTGSFARLGPSTAALGAVIYQPFS